MGLIHRDIKPANLLVFGSPAGVQGKLADFGFARGESIDARSYRRHGFRFACESVRFRRAGYFRPALLMTNIALDVCGVRRAGGIPGSGEARNRGHALLESHEIMRWCVCVSP
ncbi:unnamed protein product, partial [Hapterophycus canaliculatus]